MNGKTDGKNGLKVKIKKSLSDNGEPNVSTKNEDIVINLPHVVV